MENKKLNSLVVLYQQTKDDDTFTKIYELVAKTWRNLEAVARSLHSNVHEVTALYEDVLLKCVDRYDGKTNFINFYNFSLSRARADLYKKKKRRYEFEVYIIDTDEFENDEEYFFNRDNKEDSTAATVLKKKMEANQRQLIDFLVRDADDLTTAIVKVALAYQPRQTLGRSASFERQIADTLGIDKRTVKRKLTRLASKFDSKKLGDYHDFLVAQ